jgi:hypothetical protein
MLVLVHGREAASLKLCNAGTVTQGQAVELVTSLPYMQKPWVQWAVWSFTFTLLPPGGTRHIVKPLNKPEAG